MVFMCTCITFGSVFLLTEFEPPRMENLFKHHHVTLQPAIFFLSPWLCVQGNLLNFTLPSPPPPLLLCLMANPFGPECQKADVGGNVPLFNVSR